MSGGRFNYAYTHVHDLGESIELEVRGDADLPEDLRDQVLAVGLELQRLSTLAHAIEWYYSGDYGEDTLRKALNLEIRK